MQILYRFYTDFTLSKKITAGLAKIAKFCYNKAKKTLRPRKMLAAGLVLHKKENIYN